MKLSKSLMLITLSLLVTCCAVNNNGSTDNIESNNTSETSSINNSSISSYNDDSVELNDEIQKIYNLYLANGGELSYESWLATIKGEKGDKGDKGDPGENGLSIYDLYKKYHPEYTKTEEEFINDIINSVLVSKEDENPSELGFYPLDDGTYSANSGNARLLSNIKIPATYKGKDVVSIASYGFYDSENLKSITIPNSVKTIKNYAFLNCYELTDVNFAPHSKLERIESNVFAGCSKIESIIIPRSVNYIGNYVFDGCDALTTISYKGTIEEFTNIEKGDLWNFVEGKHLSEFTTIVCTDGVYEDTITNSFRRDILSSEDKGYSFHAVGGWGMWECNNGNKMEPTSVYEIAELDIDLATKLASKNLRYLYKTTIRIGDGSQGWIAKAIVDGELKEYDGSFTIKSVRATYNNEEQVYCSDQWMPNPADYKPAHVEALTDNIFMPAYQKEPDEYGFCWSDNPVCISEAGVYTFVVAEYLEESSESVVGYGFGLIRDTKSDLVKCTFNQAYNTAYVTFVNSGDSVIYEGSTEFSIYDYTEKVIYFYHVTGWDKSFNNITRDTSFNATYELVKTEPMPSYYYDYYD